MATYSNSRVSTYENCPYQYKLKYIDRVEVDIPTTIEAFMGDMVHQTLEKLYRDKKFQKDVPKETLLKFYKEKWDKEFTKEIKIVKKDLTAENYKKMGEKFVSDYYDTYKNDDMTILDIETQDRMTLPDGNQWHVRIDKLGCKGSTYYVCDYKTNSRMKDQEEADSDRQLAMYSSWVKDKFKDAKKVVLKWHMLAFNKEVTSERTEKQLKELQEDVVSLIKEINQATKAGNFPRKQSALCDYCLYKDLCPSFKHESILDKKTEKQYKKDDGLVLVDKFSQLKQKLKDLNNQQNELEGELINFSKQLGVDVIYGSNSKASLKEYDKILHPEDEKDKEEFLSILKQKGLYDQCSMLCFPKLQSKFLKGDFSSFPNLQNKFTKDKAWRITVSKKKSTDEND